jgi:hypothetical protein
MKNILKTIAIALVAITLSSCSKDDDDNVYVPQTINQQLIGKWYYSVTTDGEASACEVQSYFDFIDAQTLKNQRVIDDFGFVIVGFDLVGDCWFSNYPQVNYTLNENNDIQFLNEYEDTVTLKIVSISETKLVLTEGDFIFILTKNL